MHLRATISMTLMGSIFTLYFWNPRNTLCMPPKFCINYCLQMLFGWRTAYSFGTFPFSFIRIPRWKSWFNRLSIPTGPLSRHKVWKAGLSHFQDHLKTITYMYVKFEGQRECLWEIWKQSIDRKLERKITNRTSWLFKDKNRNQLFHTILQLFTCMAYVYEGTVTIREIRPCQQL